MYHAVMPRSAPSLLLLCLLCLVACAGADGEAPSSPEDGDRPDPPAASNPRPAAFAFACGELALVAMPEDDLVQIRMPDRALTLPQVPAASGAKYQRGEVSFWSKGEEATLVLDGREYACRLVPDPFAEARGRGIVFRALGQEPGWVLDLEPATGLHLVYDYGEQEATVPFTVPVVGPGRTRIESGNGRDEVAVVIEPRFCADAMSGAPFPATVTVTVNGRTLQGCGARLVPGAPPGL